MRTFWIIILLALWLLLGYFMCSASRDCCVAGDEVSKVINEAPSELAENRPPPTTVRESGPLLFNWNSSSPITNNQWTAYKDSLLSRLGDGAKLRIVGQYFRDEENTSSYENMGVARAHDIKAELFPELNDDQVEYGGQLKNLRAGVRDNPFVSADFGFVNRETVKEIDGKAIVMFPFNSTRRITDPAVETYLKDLADRLKQTQEKVRVTGHTCDIGTSPSNKTLGMWRAEVVQEYLVRNGINGSRIQMRSDGEENPRVPNTNEANRKQNRRAEIEIIQ